MTPQEQVTAYVRSQVGYAADSAKRNKYAQKLDALGFVYNGAKNGYDWCDVFADCSYIECFGVDLALRMIYQPRYSCGAGCSFSADYYRQADAFASSPSLAAQAFFGVPYDEGHTGIVVEWTNDTVTCVEGNVGGGGGRVDYRTHRRYGGDVVGYGVPDWELAEGAMMISDDDARKIARFVLAASIDYKNGVDDSKHTASLASRVGYIDYDTHKQNAKLDEILKLLKGEA